MSSFGDLTTPGAQLDVHGRARQGELPTRRASRRVPPYGTKDDATRVIPVMDQVGALQSDSDQRKERLRLSFGRGAARDKNRPRPSRRQGDMVTELEKAALLAKRAELALTLEGMRLMQRDQERQAMAKRYHIPDDLTPYLPPVEFVNEVQKQHDVKCRQAADAALAKKQQSFWDSWLEATEALSR